MYIILNCKLYWIIGDTILKVFLHLLPNVIFKLPHLFAIVSLFYQMSFCWKNFRFSRCLYAYRSDYITTECNLSFIALKKKITIGSFEIPWFLNMRINLLSVIPSSNLLTVEEMVSIYFKYRILENHVENISYFILQSTCESEVLHRTCWYIL